MGLKLKIISVKLPKEVTDLLEALVANGEYNSKSDIIRRALIDFLRNLMKKNNLKLIPEQMIWRAITALEAITY